MRNKEILTLAAVVVELRVVTTRVSLRLQSGLCLLKPSYFAWFSCINIRTTSIYRHKTKMRGHWWKSKQKNGRVRSMDSSLPANIHKITRFLALIDVWAYPPWDHLFIFFPILLIPIHRVKFAISLWNKRNFTFFHKPRHRASDDEWVTRQGMRRRNRLSQFESRLVMTRPEP